MRVASTYDYATGAGRVAYCARAGLGESSPRRVAAWGNGVVWLL